MDMQLVKSSQINAVGFDGSTLRVEFKPAGSLYDYFEVPRSTFDAMISSESVGKYFGAHVRGKFKFAKIETKREAA